MPEHRTRKRFVAAKSGNFALPPGSFLAVSLCILVFIAPLRAQDATSGSATYPLRLRPILRPQAGESRFRFHFNDVRPNDARIDDVRFHFNDVRLNDVRINAAPLAAVTADGEATARRSEASPA